MLNETFSLCCPDTKYIVVMVDDHLEYHGVLSVSIRYNPESKQWVALSEKSADFIATSSVSGPSLLLGPQSWRVSNDSADCSAQSYSARLSLSSCQGGNSQSGSLSHADTEWFCSCESNSSIYCHLKISNVVTKSHPISAMYSIQSENKN